MSKPLDLHLLFDLVKLGIASQESRPFALGQGQCEGIGIGNRILSFEVCGIEGERAIGVYNSDG